MAKKSNKKILYISLIVLILIIIAGILMYVQKTSNPALSECIKEWKAKNLKPSAYAAGAIFVEFGSGVTEQDAKQLIQKYKLSILRSYISEDYNHYSAYLEVPVGSEFKWTCKFNTNALVYLGSIVYK